MTTYADLHPSLRRVVDSTLDKMEEPPMITAVELDMVTHPGEDTHSMAAILADRYDLAVVSVEEPGPAGWPTVVFAGPQSRVEDLLWDTGYDQEPLETYEVG